MNVDVQVSYISNSNVEKKTWKNSDEMYTHFIG